MDRPVSIIVIAHRNDRTLVDCLTSAGLASRNGDQKILVLNHPSKSVLNISRQFSHEWQILREDTLVGPQHARNVGASVARHPYLVFIDDDIRLSRSWIELMLDQFTDPRIAVAQGHIRFEKKKKFFWNYLRYRNLGYFQKMKAKVPIRMCDTAAIVVKKRWFEAVQGFSKDLRIGEDSFFAIKMTTYGGVIKFNSSQSVDQIYDEEETFLKHLKQVRFNAKNILPLYLKANKPNYIDLKQFLLRKNRGCDFPWSFILIHFVLSAYFHACLNAERVWLPSGMIHFKTRSNKTDLFDRPSGV